MVRVFHLPLSRPQTKVFESCYFVLILLSKSFIFENLSIYDYYVEFLVRFFFPFSLYSLNSARNACNKNEEYKQTNKNERQ